jgi:hypothetical protein
MKARTPQIGLALIALLLAGCTTDTRFTEQELKIKQGDFILADTNALPGSIFELRIYVVEFGDSASKIASQFQISLIELQSLNPDLQLSRLYVGQKIRVYGRKRD